MNLLCMSTVYFKNDQKNNSEFCFPIKPISKGALSAVGKGGPETEKIVVNKLNSGESVSTQLEDGEGAKCMRY